MTSPEGFVRVAAINGLIAVAAGAMGAHALESVLEPERLETFGLAARYQMYHALALAAVAWMADRTAARSVRVAGLAFAVGIVLFSGSLYALALSGWGILGAVTPFGGVAFLVGWIALFVSAGVAGSVARGERGPD